MRTYNSILFARQRQENIYRTEGINENREGALIEATKIQLGLRDAFSVVLIKFIRSADVLFLSPFPAAQPEIYLLFKNN